MAAGLYDSWHGVAYGDEKEEFMKRIPVALNNPADKRMAAEHTEQCQQPRLFCEMIRVICREP
jgi:hypothetical protein